MTPLIFLYISSISPICHNLFLEILCLKTQNSVPLTFLALGPSFCKAITEYNYAFLYRTLLLVRNNNQIYLVFIFMQSVININATLINKIAHLDNINNHDKEKFQIKIKNRTGKNVYHFF